MLSGSAEPFILWAPPIHSGALDAPLLWWETAKSDEIGRARILCGAIKEEKCNSF
jgi:hypothetical protein